MPEKPAPLCGQCQKNPVVLTVTEVGKDGQKVEVHLCRVCAQARGLVLAEVKKADIAEILEELKGKVLDTDQQLTCPKCRTSYADFKKTGRLGCEICYAAFAARLDPVIKRIHGATRHVGRGPGPNGAQAARNFEIQRLRRELSKAIAAEDYERAAAVRDKIRTLGDENGEPESDPDGPGGRTTGK